MVKGGARSRSGPAPDPSALRRERDAGEWTILPVEGRKGQPVPDFPLLGETIREGQLWELLWAKPQALMWQRLGLEFEVALYVRRMAEAEVADSKVNLGTLVRQMGDSLGLTAPGMRANRWRMATDEVADKREERRGAARRPSSRSRLKIAADGDGG